MTVKQRLSDGSRRLRRVLRARRLETALGIAIAATLVLTLVSLTIYKVGGFYRYDLSRPGYENERANLATTPSGASLDTTSPITQKSVGEFITKLDKHRQNLEAYNAFGDGGLSDEDLELAPLAAP